MQPPPLLIDGATVLAWFVASEPLGRILGVEAGTEVYAQALCSYAGEKSIYRFSCGHDWRVLQDSIHATIDEAKSAALELYRVPVDAWQTRAPPERIEVRQLGPDDVSLLRGLLATFASGFEDLETYTGAPPRDAYLADLLGRGSFIALAAVDATAVVGGLTAYELPKPEQERSEIYIYDLAVALPYRRRGLATRLIAHLQDVARSRGVEVIYVQADLGDDAAIALYTKLGVREDVLHFDILPR